MKRPDKAILKLLVAECATGLTLGVFLCVLNEQIGMSALAGVTIFLLPNTYFTLYAFRDLGTEHVPWKVRLFYRGQARKLMLVAVGFALAFNFVKPLNPIALFGAFGLMTFIHVLLAARAATEIAGSPGKTDGQR